MRVHRDTGAREARVAKAVRREQVAQVVALRAAQVEAQAAAHVVPRRVVEGGFAHRGGGQQAFALLRQHLGEARAVIQVAKQPGVGGYAAQEAGVFIMHHTDEELARQRVDLGGSDVLTWRVKFGVRHAQRVENKLPGQHIQRLPIYLFQDAAQHDVPKAAVAGDARLALQRQRQDGIDHRIRRAARLQLQQHMGRDARGVGHQLADGDA